MTSVGTKIIWNNAKFMPFQMGLVIVSCHGQPKRRLVRDIERIPEGTRHIIFGDFAETEVPLPDGSILYISFGDIEIFRVYGSQEQFEEAKKYLFPLEPVSVHPNMEGKVIVATGSLKRITEHQQAA